MPFNTAKAVAMFLATFTTLTASIMNLKHKLLDFRLALPLIVTSLTTSPIGAYSSKFIDTYYVKWGYLFFLLFAAAMLITDKKQNFTTQNSGCSIPSDLLSGIFQDYWV